jgi:Transglutaminase-like superfamily/Coenzyme PQQ synthesis protein D (PqqD)
MLRSASLRTQSTIYMTVVEDGGVLFDPEHDRLLKLNKVAVEMWTGLHAGQSIHAVVQETASRYSVPACQVEEDVRKLLVRAGDLGLSPADDLMTTAQSQPEGDGQTSFPWYGQDGTTARPVPERLAVLGALVGLLFFDLVLKVFSLKALCACVEGWNVRRTVHGDRIAIIGRVCTAVERACVWYPKKALCLQRSAVVTCMLRSRGIPARLVVGVRSMPFLAHAWVEVENAVINDWPRVRTFYNSIRSY